MPFDKMILGKMPDSWTELISNVTQQNANWQNDVQPHEAKAKMTKTKCYLTKNDLPKCQ